MSQRRQEKMARVIKQAVSDVILNHMHDPRIKGFVSVTEVQIAADIKNADVYLSVMGGDEKTQRRTFSTIKHAAGHIQSLIGEYVRSRRCPHLIFHEDKRLKKTLKIMDIINNVSMDFQKNKQDDERLGQ